MILAAFIGLIGGFASGLFGIGGGSIRIPLLYLAGFSLIAAYGMNLLALPLTTLTGAVSHKHNINLRIGSLMVVGGSMGTVLGTLVAFSIAASAILISVIFVVASIIAVVAMNMSSIAPGKSKSLKPTSIKVISGTFVCNTLTGMRGGSEGSLFVPLLRALNIDMHKAIGTALFSAVFTSIVGVLLYWNTGQLLFMEGVILLLGSSVGAKLGSLLSIKTNSQSLKIGLSLLIILLAAVTVVKGVFF